MSCVEVVHARHDRTLAHRHDERASPDIGMAIARGTQHPQVRQGRPPMGVDLRLVGDDGEPVLDDGQTSGHLCVRGWVMVARATSPPSA